ncbi:MAG: DUF1080 domain-containing protein, partial [Rhodothermales bacterium]|nr:DUF1080 domain-containing protein [Rhodothermales bacterium]
NEARLIVRGDSVQHWLNGFKLVDYVLGDADWQRRARSSKFIDMQAYGKLESGNIVLQDHDEPVWFRNIRIRKFD